MKHENWMKNLDPLLKNTSICYLAIPGSHDSLSFSVDRRSSISPDAPRIAKLLSKICGPLSRKIVYNWCVTQNANLKQQFLLGIRYYDLRIAKKGSKIYSCHALYGMDILEALTILKELLDTHDQEIVVLDFQHIYNFDDVDHTFLIDMLHFIFGDRICPPVKDVSQLTLRWMQENNFQVLNFAYSHFCNENIPSRRVRVPVSMIKASSWRLLRACKLYPKSLNFLHFFKVEKVIVVYRDKFVRNVSNFWPSSKWVTLWPHTTDITQLYKYLVQTLKTRSPNSGFVSQCLFTPSPLFVVCHLWSTLKKKCAIKCDVEIKSWIQSQRSLSTKGVNVIIADFIDLTEFDFCSSVLDINRRSLQSNLRM